MKVNRRIRSGPDPVAALRAGIEALRTAGYGPELLRERLVRPASRTTSACSIAPPPWSGCAPAAAAADVGAAALLSRGGRAAPRQCTGCFGAAGTRDLVAARVLRRRGARLQARLRVDVHERLALIADRRFTATDLGAFGLPRGDMVYPPGSDSVLLAEAVPVAQRRARARPLHRQRHPGAAGRGRARRGVIAVDIGAARGGDGARQRARSTMPAASRCGAATSTRRCAASAST